MDWRRFHEYRHSMQFAVRRTRDFGVGLKVEEERMED